MSQDNTIDEKVEPQETEYDMEALRASADRLGITYSNKIGGKKLKEKIDLHIEDVKIIEPIDTSSFGVKSVGPNKSIKDLEKAARKPVTVIITDNNVLDIDNPTIIHGVQNAYFKVGPVIIKKDVEQDVPTSIINALKVKTMVRWVPSVNNITKRPTGNKIAKTVKRYNIQYV